MQSSMGDRLKRAAASPSKPLDLSRARRRGMLQRGGALAIAMLCVAGAITAAVAHPGSPLRNERAAAPAGDPCLPAGPLKLTAFLRDDVTPPELREITDYLATNELVSSFDHVSKAAAFQEFKEIYEDQPEYWDNLPNDALPASFRLEVADGADPQEIEQILSSLPGVETVVRSSRPARANGCAPPGTALICAPVPGGALQTAVRAPEDEFVRHPGIKLEIVVAPSEGCTGTIYVELDGTPMVPPDGEGPSANGFTTAADAGDACVFGNVVTGDLLYEGRHTVSVGTGCDPSLPGPYRTQHTFQFDGDRNSLWPPVPSHDAQGLIRQVNERAARSTPPT